MPVFAYKATDPSTGLRSGTIVADTPRSARDSLRRQGLSIQDVRPHAAAGGSARLSLGLRAGPSKRHRVRTVSFIRELATLLGVGIPLLEAIDTISRQYRGPFHAVMLQLRDQIASGVSLADAMRRQPDIFDEFCINITEVGENAGTLEGVLERLADFKERSMTLKNQVVTALLYPAIVLCMAVGVSIFLMTFVVPKLLEGLIQAGRPIPFPTRMVKMMSDLMLNDWWILLPVVILLCAAVAALLRWPPGKRFWHRMVLRLPILGEMTRKQAILRIAVIISTLMRSGIVFLRALQIAQRSCANVMIRDALRRCEAAVNGGQDISRAMEEEGVFPPLVLQIFSVGQQSGRLEEMLERLATDYDRQLTLMSQRLTAVLEPILILMLVVMVGFIAFATVLPMLEAANVF